SAIDLPSVLRQPGSILLVSLAVDELQRSGRMFGSLLVSAIAREVMANIDLDRRRNAVRLYVDEFENMASEGFESLIAEGRRFGLTLVLSHQTLAQLTPKLRSVIRNNAGIQIIFQCGFEDASTIAREFPEDIDAEAIRELEVGQAFVMYRDGDIVEVEFHPPKRTQESDLRAFTRSLYKQGKSDAPSQDSEPDSSDPEPLEDWL
ncbi:MAG TPA: TraM recognition domain-containing protein, partial [Fimbriimonas sp.]|nr:TraM recognition domain-containing protein [Fimbriimonas sp.]